MKSSNSRSVSLTSDTEWVFQDSFLSLNELPISQPDSYESQWVRAIANFAESINSTLQSLTESFAAPGLNTSTTSDGFPFDALRGTGDDINLTGDPGAASNHDMEDPPLPDGDWSAIAVPAEKLPDPDGFPSQHKTTTEAGAWITRDNHHWGSAIGVPPGPISFGFRTSAPDYTVNGKDVQGTFSPFTPQEQAAARLAISLWSSVANITFVDLGNTNSATILFANYSSSTDKSQAFAFYPTTPADPSEINYKGDVFMNTYHASTTNVGIGTYDFMTLVHEIGHALGLQHPGNYNAGPGQSITYQSHAEYVEDSRMYSIMSYFNETNTGGSFSVYNETPMLADIAAIQRLYTANNSTRTGNTIYGFNSNVGDGSPFSIISGSQHVVFTIWDAGGDDTLDLSGYTQNQAIDINANRFSNAGGDIANISIAQGVSIERAVGGTGADSITGNALDNTLTGGGGNDTIDGGSGTDSVVFSGLRSFYTWTSLPGNGVRVVGPDGTDTLTNVERLVFSDLTVTLQLDDFPATTLTTGVVALGGSATGTLEATGDHDWFRVSFVLGTSYVISLRGVDGAGGTLPDPFLRVYNSAGQALATDNDGGLGTDSQLTFMAPTTDSYYLDAGASADFHTGTYTIGVSAQASNDDYAANTLTTGQVAVGGSATGRIEVIADRDWFRVQLVAGSSYVIDLRGLDSGNGTLPDPFLRLYNSSGQLVTSDDDSGTGTDSLLTFVATATGLFFVEAGAFQDSSTGTYSVSVVASDDYAANTSTTGQVAVGGSATGTVEVLGDRDWFRAQLTIGNTYVINVLGVNGAGGTLPDPFLRLYNSAGQLITSDDDSGTGTDSQLTFVATATGSFFIEAGAYSDGSAGTYSVSVAAADDYAANTSTTGQVTIGGVATGNLEVTGDHDWFRVQLNGGNTYVIELRGLDGGGGNLSDPYLRVFNGFGQLLVEDDDSGTGLDSRLTFAVTTTGSYYIDAGAYADSGRGTYTVSVGGQVAIDDYFANTSTTGQVAVGGSATGTLEATGDHDWFRVQLVAGSSYVISVRGLDSGGGTLANPVLQLYNSAGQFITSDDDGGAGADSQLTFVAAATGSYFVDAGGFGNSQAGTYTVSVAISDDYAADSSTTGQIAIGGSATGNLEIVGDHDWFRVQLVAGTTYIIGLRGMDSGGGSLSDPYLRLLDGAGQLLGQDDDGDFTRDSELVFFASTSGSYFIDAGAYVDFYSGTYTVVVGMSGVAIAAASAVKAEGQSGTTSYTFTVTRSGNTSGTQSVSYAVSGSGANPASGSDFAGGVLPTGAVTFAPGETSKTITVTVQGDTTAEADEGFTVTLSNATPGLPIATGSATGTILNDDATVSLAATDATKPEGNAGMTAFIFTLTRSGDTSGSQSVSYAVSGSGANPASGSDFDGGILPTGAVSFATGETSKTITVTVQGDATLEANEGFTVTLSNVTAGLTIATGSATGTILNDDATVSLAATDATKPEGNAGMTAFIFTATRSGDTSGSQSVSYAVSGSGANAASGSDFVGGILPTGTVSFAAGETSKTITVTVQGDATLEASEDFTVTLSNATAGLTIATGTATGTIQNDDVVNAASITATSAFKAEGNSGTVSYTFAITRSGDTSAAQSVSYAVSGSGANPAAGSDFAGGVLPTGAVTFEVGETSKTITVAVVGDSTLESDEDFTVTLSSPTSGLTIATGTATGNILNDDAMLSIVATDATKLEGNAGTTALVFTVTRSGDTSRPHSASYAVSGSGANPASGSDFAGGVLPTGAVTFAVGETSKSITLTVQGDTTAETNEGFTVTLSSATPGLTIEAGAATGTILNDDATVSLAATDATKLEGNAGTTAFIFTATRSGDISGSQSVSYAVSGSGSNPAFASDFAGGVLPTGAVTFAVGETSKTITVAVQGDSALEANEDFTVTLSGATSGLTIATGTAMGTILSDDAAVSLAATDATKLEGNLGTTAYRFTVTRSGDISGSQSVSYAVSGSGANAASGSDFVGGVLPAGAVTFAAGETSKTITVDVQTDATLEANEGFAVTLSGATAGLTIATSTATGIILNDDVANTASITATDATKAEGNSGTTACTFTVTRTGDMSGSQSLSYAVSGSGAVPASGSDFAGGVLPTGVVTFAVGETTKAITVNVQGDTAVESNQEFTVTLSSATPGLTIATGSATGTILNDDATASIVATDATKQEGNTATRTAFTFAVTRSGDTSESQSVAYAVLGSGANPASASDFAGGVLPAGVVSFAEGETSKTITVNVQVDATLEANEDFTVTLSNATPGLTIATGAATGTILNDDTIPVVAHDDAFIILRSNTTVSASSGVLFNDEGSGLSVSLTAPTTHGGLQLVGNGGFTYSPLFGFTGVDSFSYSATNGGSTVSGKATLFVVPVSATPGSVTLDLLALTSEQQIAATYAAFFGRAADLGGHQFWVGEFNRLLPVQGPASLFANISSSFGVSAEARALYPFLVNPFGASDAQISAFLDSVYNNLFNRSSDAGGLAYWTAQVKATLAAGQFVGSVLVNIMSGAQDTAASKDVTTLMGKVAVSLAYVHEQDEHHTQWLGASDVAAATNLMRGVTSDPLSILTGIKSAEGLISTHP